MKYLYFYNSYKTSSVVEWNALLAASTHNVGQASSKKYYNHKQRYYKNDDLYAKLSPYLVLNFSLRQQEFHQLYGELCLRT